MCARCFCGSCALVSVRWFCPGICGERILDWALFCVW